MFEENRYPMWLDFLDCEARVGSTYYLPLNLPTILRISVMEISFGENSSTELSEFDSPYL